MIKAKVEQLVKHCRIRLPPPCPPISPVITSKAAAADKLWSPRWWLPNPHENSCPGSSSYLSRPDIVCELSLRRE